MLLTNSQSPKIIVLTILCSSTIILDGESFQALLHHCRSSAFEEFVAFSFLKIGISEKQTIKLKHTCIVFVSVVSIKCNTYSNTANTFYLSACAKCVGSIISSHPHRNIELCSILGNTLVIYFPRVTNTKEK